MNLSGGNDFLDIAIERVYAFWHDTIGSESPGGRDC